jgi:thiol-disulfide isomerase/thioredoxin
MIIIAMFVLVIGGLGVYAIMNRTDSSMTKSDSMEKKETLVKDEKMTQKEGKYAPFSPELFVSSASTRRVLFFYANWCPTCKPADKSFSDNNAQIPADVTLIRVNYNDTDTDQAEKDLAKKYGVTYQHTFVQIDAAGNEVTLWNGGQMEELLSNLK